MGLRSDSVNLPPDTSEHAQPSRLVLDLPASEEWKAELVELDR